MLYILSSWVEATKTTFKARSPPHDLLSPSLIMQPSLHVFVCLCSSEDSMEERLKRGSASLRKTCHCHQNFKCLPAGISLRFWDRVSFKTKKCAALHVKLFSRISRAKTVCFDLLRLPASSAGHFQWRLRPGSSFLIFPGSASGSRRGKKHQKSINSFRCRKVPA